MSQADFDAISSDVQKRLDWAGHHIEAIIDSFAAWRDASDPYLAGTLDDAGSGVDLHLEGLAPAPTEEWGFMIGDAVHNMRSTLNNLLHSIALASGVEATKVGHLQFPIVAAEEDWTRSNGGARKQVRVLPEHVIQSVESLQPYNRGGTPEVPQILWLLGDLSNMDKHRLATSTNQTVAVLDLTVSAKLMNVDAEPKEGEAVFINSPEVLAHVEFGQPVETYTITAKATLTVYAFDSVGRRYEAIPLMTTLLREVHGVANTVLAAWRDGSGQA